MQVLEREENLQTLLEDFDPDDHGFIISKIEKERKTLIRNYFK